MVIIAINPARQFAQARNSQRQANLDTILNGIGQDLADNKGTFGGVCASALITTPMATSSIDNGASGTGKDFSCLSPTYIPTFPSDPTVTSGVATGYEIVVEASGRIKLCAPSSVEVALGSPVELCVRR